MMSAASESARKPPTRERFMFLLKKSMSRNPAKKLTAEEQQEIDSIKAKLTSDQFQQFYDKAREERRVTRFLQRQSLLTPTDPGSPRSMASTDPSTPSDIALLSSLPTFGEYDTSSSSLEHVVVTMPSPPTGIHTYRGTNSRMDTQQQQQHQHPQQQQHPQQHQQQQHHAVFSKPSLDSAEVTQSIAYQSLQKKLLTAEAKHCSTIQILEQQVASLQTQLNNEQTAHVNQVAELRSQINSLSEELQQSEQTRRELDGQFKNLVENAQQSEDLVRDELDQKCRQLQRRCMTLEEELKTTQQENILLKQNLDRLSQELTVSRLGISFYETNKAMEEGSSISIQPFVSSSRSGVDFSSTSNLNLNLNLYSGSSLSSASSPAELRSQIDSMMQTQHNLILRAEHSAKVLATGCVSGDWTNQDVMQERLRADNLQRRLQNVLSEISNLRTDLSDEHASHEQTRSELNQLTKLLTSTAKQISRFHNELVQLESNGELFDKQYLGRVLQAIMLNRALIEGRVIPPQIAIDEVSDEASQDEQTFEPYDYDDVESSHNMDQSELPPLLHEDEIFSMDSAVGTVADSRLPLHEDDFLSVSDSDSGFPDNAVHSVPDSAHRNPTLDRRHTVALDARSDLTARSNQQLTRMRTADNFIVRSSAWKTDASEVDSSPPMTRAELNPSFSAKSVATVQTGSQRTINGYETAVQSDTASTRGGTKESNRQVNRFRSVPNSTEGYVKDELHSRIILGLQETLEREQRSHDATRLRLVWTRERLTRQLTGEEADMFRRMNDYVDQCQQSCRRAASQAIYRCRAVKESLAEMVNVVAHTSSQFHSLIEWAIEQLATETFIRNTRGSVVEASMKRAVDRPLTALLTGRFYTCCRVRPLPTMPSNHVLQSTSDLTVEVRRNIDCRVFKLDWVFGPNASQSTVCNHFVTPLVEGCLAGESFFVTSYGESASGKTHTLFGSMHVHPLDSNSGILSHVVYELFDQFTRFGPESEVSIHMVAAEILSETVIDLLKLNKKKGSAVDKVKRLDQSQLNRVRLNGFVDFESAMNQVIAHRSKTKGDLHPNKVLDPRTLEHNAELRDAIGALPKPHVVVSLSISYRSPRTDSIVSSKMTFVDMAASERTQRNDAGGVFVTKGLSAMSDVLLTLLKNGPHVPYRNSRLTHLLNSCSMLEPTTKIILLVHVNPHELHFTETVSSLTFASQLKSVAASSDPDSTAPLSGGVTGGLPYFSNVHGGSSTSREHTPVHATQGVSPRLAMTQFAVRTFSGQKPN